jgi:hypothetical protein
MKPGDVQRISPIHARVRYQVGEVKSNIVKARVVLVQKTHLKRGS